MANGDATERALAEVRRRSEVMVAAAQFHPSARWPEHGASDHHERQSAAVETAVLFSARPQAGADMPVGRQDWKPAERITRRRIASLVLLPVLAFMTGVLPARGEPENGWTRTVSKDYVMNDVGPWPGAAVCGHSSTMGVGCVGFGRVEGDFVTLTIHDAAGRPVGGLAEILDLSYGRSSYRQFCGTSGPIPATPGLLYVYLRPYNGLSIACPLAGSAVATKGRVEAVFTAAES